MADRELTCESVGHVDVITLDRPEARNALTHTTYRQLEEAVRTTSARCLVITGADPAFCAGDDVKQVMAPAGERASAGAGLAGLGLTPAAEALLNRSWGKPAQPIAGDSNEPLVVEIIQRVREPK